MNEAERDKIKALKAATTAGNPKKTNRQKKREQINKVKKLLVRGVHRPIEVSQMMAIPETTARKYLKEIRMEEEVSAIGGIGSAIMFVKSVHDKLRELQVQAWVIYDTAKKEKDLKAANAALNTLTTLVKNEGDLFGIGKSDILPIINQQAETSENHIIDQEAIEVFKDKIIDLGENKREKLNTAVGFVDMNRKR